MAVNNQQKAFIAHLKKICNKYMDYPTTNLFINQKLTET